MKERPILFSAPIVRAILDGKKTQTRRIVKPQPDFDPWHHAHIDKLWPCPYGQPGDQLWVRETFRLGANLDNDCPTWSASSCVSVGGRLVGPIKYEADGAMLNEDVLNEDVLNDFGGAWGKTRVSIHMPRWASRINLLIKSIRVERLNEISEEDAKAEGVDGTAIGEYGTSNSEYILSFGALWESIHGDNSWQQNPWVWVVEFEVMK